MKDFILLPWEYPGSSFNPKAHAETRLELGGQERDFLLKLHEGILYFKEAEKLPIFAILGNFDEALASDSAGLISAFQTEVAVGNYCAFFTRRDYFPHLPVRGFFMLLVRADGTGWMREHFDTEWFPLPDWGRPLAMNMWGDNLRAQIIVHILPTVKELLLQRTLDPEIRRAEYVHWIGGDGKEVATLLFAAAVLLIPSQVSRRGVMVNNRVSLKIDSRSKFAGEPSLFDHFSKPKNPEDYWSPLMQIMRRQFQFLGVQWSEGAEENSPRLRNEAFYHEGLQRWGENWRGNWAPQYASIEVAIPDLTAISAHEKLEAALLLRDWLKGKMPASQIDDLFQSIDLS